MTPTSKINANGVEIGIIGNITDESAYISLTDIARYKNSEDAAGVISNWLRNRNTLEYLGCRNNCIILILNSSNSRGLEIHQATMLLPFRLRNGSNQQMQLVSSLNLVDMVELMHILMLHLNLHHGFLLNSNYIL